MSEQEQELNTYEVQRKLTAWETQRVQASSFEEAQRIADENFHAYYAITETFDPTGDYWICNEDTDEERTDF